MDIILLKQIIIDQKQLYMPKKEIIYRKSFEIKQNIFSNSLISVIMGLRRSGKSVFLHHLRQNLPQNNYFLNFEDDRLAMFTINDFQTLFLAFMELYGEEENYFFDEIQNIPEWERFVRRLYDYGKKIFITGSNSTMLSKELGTKLTGRYLSYEIYPCSFYEFLQFKNIKIDLEDAGTRNTAGMRHLFQDYCNQGGLPEYYSIQTQDYLHTLYENIIYRDIINRYHISNESVIKQLVYYLASNTAKDTSFSAIAKLLNVGSSSTIAEYCQYLENSYLCFFINRFSYSLKKQYGYHKKVYFIDIALARAVGFRTTEDYGRMLENIVFLHLKRRFKDIYFHREKYECDFLIKGEHKISKAFQVSVSLSNEKTYERERLGIEEALTAYDLDEGFIITENEERLETIVINGHHKKIHIVPIWKWLLQIEAV